MKKASTISLIAIAILAIVALFMSRLKERDEELLEIAE